MGNEQSTPKKRQKANAEKKVQNGELNGHAAAAPEETEPETSKEAAVEQKSETPPAPVTNQPKPPEKEEVDSSKANGPAHLETTPEQKTTKSSDAETHKKAAKPSGDEMSSFIGKMFKKKSEPVKPAAENNDSVDAPVKAVDLKIDMKPDKVLINADQKEILDEVAEKIKLQLVDSIPVQPISSGFLTKHVPLESSNTDEILPDRPATQEPVAEEPVKRKARELHTGHLKSEEELLVDAQAVEDEEPKTEDAEKALKEDTKLIQLVESITSEEKKQSCENNVDVEEPVVGAEEPLLVAEEIADDVEEIFHITQEQESLDAEESEEHQGNMCKETLVVTEDPSVEAALIAGQEIVPATSEFILAVNRSMTVDEDSWVIIQKPARPLNTSGLLEEPALTRTKWYSEDSSQLLSQLRSTCTKVLEDASYKPLSVDVCADESTIHITVELRPDELTCLNKDPVDIKSSTEPEPEAEALKPSPVEAAEEKNPSEEAKAAEKTVMNFFKTFVTPTKTSKEAKATPDASKEQEAPKAPPPPPPAPPKMESKAEPAVKKEDTSATKAAAAAATKAEGSAKSKTKDSALGKLFRSKPVVVEEKKPVEVQVDASKSSTLEAAAKPQDPPAPKPEEKKPEKKSTFGSMFKPKAPEPKKETPAAPPAAEAAPPVKAKEEAPQATPDNKSAESTENASPNMPHKLEKRNSFQLFFKNLAK
ncbi:breast carcinoma-amplified sequence 1 isoform X5 [Carassius gibelio]|uniref:breast carcinoma-amplified sequence 1 isoform X5 n=1 Tax=Carassius gibelio TaxID=101364 RepID=UPI002279D3AF|nr:breast carcinoma-amplified sequence 1 isoform X5 [Carassius gibelio]